MWTSIKELLKDMFKGLYFWISFVLVLFAIYDYFIKDELPQKYQRYINMPIEAILILLIVVIMLGAIKAYHKLRMTRLEELYKYLPEANKDRIFRIFYELGKEGESLRQASTERKQAWDERVLKAIKDNCQGDFGNIYLLNTGRRYKDISKLQDENYEAALKQIKELIDDQNFNLFIKS